MKNCKYRVESANAGMWLYWFWHHLFIFLIEETVLYTTNKVCKILFLTTVCNQFPTLTLNIVGLRIYNGKSVKRLEHSQMEKNQSTDTWVVEYGCVFDRDKRYSSQINFTTTPNLSTATDDFRSPNTRSWVTCFRGKVKFSSRLSGSPTSPG